MTGQTISHYKLLEKLGGGSMGVVYKAQDLKLDRFVALKFLSHHLSADEEEKKRFIHEAKAASALDHPNIAMIHAVEEVDGLLKDGVMFMVVEFIEKSLQGKNDYGKLESALSDFNKARNSSGVRICKRLAG